MSDITIRQPYASNKEFEKLLKENMERLIHEKIRQNNLGEYNTLVNGSNKAGTTIRLTIATKNKLKKMLNSGETYEDLVLRLIERDKELKEKRKFIKEMMDRQDNYAVNYSEERYSRARGIYIYHPDLKIEYSYNFSRTRGCDGTPYNLQIEKYILQGETITEKEGIKSAQTISIIKSLSNVKISNSVRETIREKEALLDSDFDYIKTKYLIYFKILYGLVGGKVGRIPRDENLLDINFWKDIYYRKDWNQETFQEDVRNKLSQFDSEISQIQTDLERKTWRLNLDR
ncbi:hypothetical protein CEE44_00605 [Candidatus Woesearchaeota archaeon B3_Woes]|nr:MAG: hypothetical protein CEE44_00605 [Candidatus Woesearchaeota archaeon B3_Woes]